MKKRFYPLVCALSIVFAATGTALTGCDDHTEAFPVPPTVSEEEQLPPVLEEPAAPSEEEPVTEPSHTVQPEPEPEPEPPAVPQPKPTPEPEPEPEPKTVQYVSVKTNGLNVRKGASTSYASLGTADKGELLAFEKMQNGWYKTRYRGQTAYVSASSAHAALVTMERGDERVESVIAQGLDRLGVPYVYGAVRLHDGKGNKIKGFTTEKFDCSSLMQYMFYEGANVLLGTTTRTQVLQGKSVKRSAIRRGDLLFFTNASRKNNTGIERVGHVGLYLGDGYMLHTSSDYAKIEKISAARWDYYLEARRVL